MTRLLLILLVASFAFTVLAAVSRDTAADRRAVLSVTPEKGVAAHAVARRGPAARVRAPAGFAST